MKIILPKKLAVILLFLVCYNGLSSQVNTYQPFPEKYGKWIVQHSGPYGINETGPLRYSFTKYETEGDTTIANVKYKKVSEAHYSGFPPPQLYLIHFGPKKYSFSYRNDIPNKKIYILITINGQYKDSLWYDFNLKIGDTLKFAYSIRDFNVSHYENNRIIVNSIDSIMICGHYYKKFNFKCGGGFRTNLIEGVGFEDNFIQSDFRYCPFEPLYLYDTRFFCTSTAIPNYSNASTKQFLIYPNPVSTALTIEYPADNHTTALPQYSIVDCLGKELINGTLYKENIDIANLSNGIYFIIVKNQSGNIYQEKFIKQN